MAGDIPPTPFLTKRMENIGGRLVRKGWPRSAFRRLREEERKDGSLPFPGDLIRSHLPDIHGEYRPTVLFQDPAWQARIEKTLDAVRGYAEQLARLLEEGSTLDLPGERARPHGPHEVRRGPDQAERNSCARARRVWPAAHVRHANPCPRVVHGAETQRGDSRQSGSTVDRDLDLAIDQFAPGSTVVIDKREHLAVRLHSQPH